MENNKIVARIGLSPEAAKRLQLKDEHQMVHEFIANHEFDKARDILKKEVDELIEITDELAADIETLKRNTGKDSR